MHAHAHTDGHSHGHGSALAHGHHGASRHAGRKSDRRRLTIVLCLSATYMFAEAIGGLLTGSLALLADAGHLLSDVGSLTLGLFALWIAQRPITSRRTYGHTRVEILAALAQGVALVAVAIVIAVEAVERLGVPREVDGVGMMWIATGALAINTVGLLVLNARRADSINIRGVWLHVASDALGSLGVIAAGAVIWILGWMWADSVVSLVISALVAFAAWLLVRDAVDILMEGAPGHLDVEDIRRGLAGLGGVSGVHDLHVWTIGNGEISLSSHLVAAPGADPSALLREADSLLASRFSIHHTTVQIEPPEHADGEACETSCEEPEAASG